MQLVALLPVGGNNHNERSHSERHRPANHMYDGVETIRYIESQFPVISADLHDEVVEGLLHPQMGVFSRLAQSAIDEGDLELWRAITAVFMEVWRNCSPEVANALNVSFLEHLHFEDEKIARSWAYRAMPEQMRRTWDEMEEYNRSTHGG